jgi:hypothetical protein
LQRQKIKLAGCCTPVGSKAETNTSMLWRCTR